MPGTCSLVANHVDSPFQSPARTCSCRSDPALRGGGAVWLALPAPLRRFSQSLAVDGLVEVHRRGMVWRCRDSPSAARILARSRGLQPRRGAAGLAAARACRLPLHGRQSGRGSGARRFGLRIDSGGRVFSASPHALEAAYTVLARSGDCGAAARRQSLLLCLHAARDPRADGCPADVAGADRGIGRVSGIGAGRGVGTVAQRSSADWRSEC